MNVYGLLPNFKVVEINNAVALRSGHIIAQSPMAKADYLDGNADYVENGYVLYLDVDGKLKSPAELIEQSLRMTQQPILHFTEEIFTTGLSQELRHFAVEWNADNECYPRGLVLNVGDTFTTNNFSGTLAGATVAKIDDNGQFTIHADMAALRTDIGSGNTYMGPLFSVEESTLPDGETDAVELTVITTFTSISIA